MPNDINDLIIVIEFPEGNLKQLLFNSIHGEVNELYYNRQNEFLLISFHQLAQ